MLLAFCSGAVTVLSFAPFDQAWLAFPALAILFFLWKDATPAQAFRLGWAFGCGLLGFGVFWLRNSIAQFGGVSLPLAIVITLAFAISVALLYGLSGWLASKLSGQRKILGMLVIFPASWVLGEWVRGWFLGGFPWLSIGYSQINMPLAGYAEVLGIFGVSLAVAVSAGALNLLRSKWVLLLVPVWLLGAALQTLNWTESSGDPIRVSMVQGNIPQQIKWQADQFGPTMDLYLGEGSRLLHSDLVIWPETAIPAYAHRVEDQVLAPLHDWLREGGQDLLTGIVVQEEDGVYYNALISLGRSGRAHYYKRHLVPFGEFLPLKFLLRPLIDILAIPMSDFSVGDSQKPIIKLAGYTAGLSICYEDVFGEEVIDALPEADFLVNVSNDAWFGASLAPAQHLQIARMRAVETDRFLLRSTNTGISAIIDRDGAVIASIPQFEKATVTAIIEPRTGLTPYSRFGNYSVVLLVLLMLVAGYWFGRQKPL